MCSLERTIRTVNVTATRSLSLAVIVGLGLGVASCGDDGVRPVATTATEAPSTPVKPAKSSTPRAEWVLATCRSLARVNDSVQPPSVQPSTPQKTKESLERFYTDLAAVLTEQEKALVAVGEPPGRNAGRDYREMLTRLKDVQTQLTELKGRVSAADLKTADDLNDLLEVLGRRMQKMATYQGPIADLVKSRALGASIGRESACSKLSSGLTTAG